MSINKNISFMKFVFFHKHIFNSLHLNCKKSNKIEECCNSTMSSMVELCNSVTAEAMSLLCCGLGKNLIFELCHRGRNGTRWSSVSNRAALMTGFPRKHRSLSCISCRFILGGVEICKISTIDWFSRNDC